MGRISIENVNSAVRKIGAMSTVQQLALFDEMAQTQPNLLASFLVQNKLNAGNGGLEHIINMLLVCYQSMKESKFSWPIISEDEQEWQMRRMTATVNFPEILHTRESSTNAMQQFLDAHPEKPLLAYVLGETNSRLAQLSAHGTEAETDKYFLMASLNIVNCIAHAQSVTRAN